MPTEPAAATPEAPVTPTPPAGAPTTPEATQTAHQAGLEADAVARDEAMAFFDDSPEFGEDETPAAEPEAKPDEKEVEAKPDGEPEKPAEGEPAAAAEQDAAEDDILAKLRADGAERRQKAEAAKATETATVENIELKAQLAALTGRLDEILRDPTMVIKTKEDYEKLTQRILRDGQETGDTTGIEAKLDALNERLDKADKTRDESAQQQARATQIATNETTYHDMVTGEEGAKLYPTLAKLPKPDQIALAYQVADASQGQHLDDKQIAAYSEQHLRQYLKKLGVGADDSAEAKPKADTPRSGSGAQTLTNQQAADAPARAVVETEEEKERAGVMDAAQDFLDIWNGRND